MCDSLVCLAHRLYHCTVSCVLTQFEQVNNDDDDDDDDDDMMRWRVKIVKQALLE